MPVGDLFGLQRESKIIRAGIREIFTPHSPIQSYELFFGRQREVQKIIEQVNTPGQHSILYGDRGVGKSSLANIVTQLIITRILKGKLFIKRCDSKDNFLTILEDPLLHCGVAFNLTSTTKSHKQSGSAGLKLPIAQAGINSENNETQTFKSQDISPSKAAKILGELKGLLCIDEADRITNDEDKRQIAELVKLLSDNNSKFKILIVGIANTAEELIGAHPSVNRCLKETMLRRMADQELEQIITKGALKAHLQFDNDVTESIVRLSAGYPHFTHLLALKCAEEAVAMGNTRVDLHNLSQAISCAAEDAEGALRRKYNETIRSYSTSIYKTILNAASRLGRDEFTAGQLRDKISELTGINVSQDSLNNSLKRLISNDHSAIMTRVSRGVYKFCDPRMPSFVRIINNDLS